MAGGVHFGVGQQPQFFELVWVQEVSLVAGQYDPAVPFGGEQVGRLGHQLGLRQSSFPATWGEDLPRPGTMAGPALPGNRDYLVRQAAESVMYKSARACGHDSA